MQRSIKNLEGVFKDPYGDFKAGIESIGAAIQAGWKIEDGLNAFPKAMEGQRLRGVFNAVPGVLREYDSARI